MCKGPAVFACLLLSVLIIGSGRVYAQAACPSVTSLDIVNADCGGNGASITIHATGGSGSLEYSVSTIKGGAWQASNVFNNAPVGAFVAYVRDAFCGGSKQSAVLKNCLSLHVEGTNPGCTNDNGTITAIASDGVEPYQYSIDKGATWQNSGIFTGKPAGQYQVIVVDASIPSQSTSSPITLQQICIRATVTPHDATCGQDNGTLDISASGGIEPYTYIVNGASYTDAHITGLPPGPKIIQVNDANSPGPTLNTTIDAAALPTLTTTPTAATCVDNDGVVVINGATGPTPYQYALDGGDYSPNGTINQVSSGNHQAHVKDGNGCIASQTVTVPLNDNLTVDGGPDVPVCQGSSRVIQAASNGTTFSWQPGTGLNNPHILQPTVSPTAGATYTLTASLGVCQRTASVNVVVIPAPIAIVEPGTNICYGKSIQLQGSGDGRDYRFSWTPAGHLDNPASASPTARGLTETTTYHLTVTDTRGCRSLNAADVTITITPPPRVFAGNDTSVLLGQPVPLHAVDVDNVGLGGWVWNPSDGLNNDQIKDPIARPQQTITYTATGYTFNGCGGSASITVNVFSVSGIFVPNAFTPNGDGHNDVLRPALVGIKELKYFAVFDRWGQRIFYTTNPTEGWRGHSNGKDQPMGTYVWMVGGVDYKGTLVQQKGTVLLIR